METHQLQNAQSGIVSTLDYIESQQQQLDKELDQFESKLKQVLATTPSSSGTNNGNTSMASSGYAFTASPYGGTGMSAEQAREHTYDLAETLSRELVELNAQVADMVDVVNRVWKRDGVENEDSNENNENSVCLSIFIHLIYHHTTISIGHIS